MKENNIRVRIPQVRSIEGAVRLYYERSELTNNDIKQLFDVHSSATIAKLKKLAREKMIEGNISAWNAQNVNTAAAYEAWGLSIDDLEAQFNKLKRLSA